MNPAIIFFWPNSFAHKKERKKRKRIEKEMPMWLKPLGWWAAVLVLIHKQTTNKNSEDPFLKDVHKVFPHLKSWHERKIADCQKRLWAEWSSTVMDYDGKLSMISLSSPPNKRKENLTKRNLFWQNAHSVFQRVSVRNSWYSKKIRSKVIIPLLKTEGSFQC